METQETDSRLLREASAQEIQLELIRRAQHNALDGRRVYDFLMAHRDQWESVMLERLAVSGWGKLPAMGMIKLRDLPYNEWNVDTLYILCRDRETAKALSEQILADDWGGELQLHDDDEDVQSALGGSRSRQYAIVSIWWD